MDRTGVEPRWFRELGEDARAGLAARFWAEGRLKLEPWLASRIDHPAVRLWPRSTVAAGRRMDGGSLEVTLDTGDSFETDFVVFATGYRVDIERVPFLTAGNVLPALEVRNGAPALGADLQSSVPGLYFTSMAATQDFGPFFAFTVSARTSSRLIGDSLRARPA
jgi:hypothetical protein